MNRVFYSDDINLLSHWQRSVEETYSVAERLEELMELKERLIVVNYSACENDCSRVLHRLNEQKNRVLVLDRTPSFKKAQKLLYRGAYGYGNAIMRAHFIMAAIRTIEEDLIWLYPEFTSELIKGVPPKEAKSENLLDVLSTSEKEVALLLRDAFTYKEIAEKLHIAPRTVKAHAQQIYTKLNVKDRLAHALLLR